MDTMADQDHNGLGKHIVVKESLEVLIIIMAMLVVYTFFVYCKKTLRRSMPGPWLRWPVLGNLPSYSRHSLHEQLSKTANIYGAVFILRFYSRKIVVVNNNQAIGEIVSRSSEFNYVPVRYAGKVTLCGGKIIDSDLNTITLKHHRKVCESGLHEFITTGVAKRVVDFEISEILHEFHRSHNIAFDPEEYIRRGIINVIFTAVFGERFTNQNDPEYINISLLISALKELDDHLEILELLSEKEFEDNLREDLREKLESLFETYERRLKQHQDTLQEKGKTKDIIDSLIKARDGAKRKSSTSVSFSDSYRLSAIHDIVTDELADTVATIRCCIFFLCKYPEYQKAVQEEIDQVLSTRGRISVQERHKFPLLQAVILETIRLANIKPFGSPHKATTETILMGYKIPRDAIIVTNLWAVRMNPELFSEPEKFDPYRFLDSNGKLILNVKRLVFPGTENLSPEKKLAEIEVFFFVAFIMKEFFIELAENVKFQSRKYMFSSLQPYDIVARPRGSLDRKKFDWKECCNYRIAVLTQTFLATEE